MKPRADIFFRSFAVIKRKSVKKNTNWGENTLVNEKTMLNCAFNGLINQQRCELAIRRSVIKANLMWLTDQLAAVWMAKKRHLNRN